MKKLTLILSLIVASLGLKAQSVEGFVGLKMVSSDTVQVVKLIVGTDLVSNTTQLTAVDTTLVTLDYLTVTLDSLQTAGFFGGQSIDSIFTTPDYTFPIEYLKYTANDDTVTVTDIPKPDGVMFPGYVTHQSGLTFAVSAAAYYIRGDLYTSPSTSITLAAADATYDRIDLFVVDTLGQASVITGTPSATPIQPQYDPTSQLPLIPMGVHANATTPTPPGGQTITSEVVYDENTEWTTSANGVVVDFAQTTTFHNGSIAAETGTLSNGDYISFTAATAYASPNYETLSFWLKLKQWLWMKDDLVVRLYSNGNPIGQMVKLDYNYRTTDWQFIAIDMADFGTIALFDEIRIINDLFKYTSPDGWYIDFVRLQGGIQNPVTVGAETDPTVPDLVKGITAADTTRWGTDNIGTDDQTASEVPVTVQNGIEQNNVQAELEALREDMANGGDGWGTDTVTHDETLTGPGTVGDPLKVDTTLIETKAHAEATYLQTETDGDPTNELDSIYDANSAQWLLNGDTIPEISASGLTSVEYDDLETDLTGNTTNNTVTWDIDGSGIITSAISSSGTVAFTNPKVNKTVCVVLTLSSGATLTWPSSAKILAGSATLADGTFYVYIHCISSTLYTISITQEGS